MKNKKILITGVAGFIGSTLATKLLLTGNKIIGIDNFDVFYDRSIKEKNIEAIKENPSFKFYEGDILNLDLLNKIEEKIDIIIHIAAKAGVRPSIENPREYQEVNVIGTQNMLDLAVRLSVHQFVFASSSSVYGVNKNVPWSEKDKLLLPISPYASTKLSCEMLGHVYKSIHNIRFIGLRFFTVYGPKQRPDLAIHKFTDLIYNDKEIPLFGDGSSERDYTFIDDIVSGVISACNYDKTNYEIINIGNSQTVSLIQMVNTIEKALNKKAKIKWLPMQAGDVPTTYADISKANQLLGYNPETSFEEGIKKFVSWYLNK